MTPDRRKHRLRLAGSALARPLDVRHPSNVTAAAGAGLAGLAALALTTFVGDGLSLPTAARVGIGVFLGWALARELSPDHVHAATLALVVTAAVALFEVPAIGVNVVALVAIRAWAGTVGHHPTVVDFLGVVALSAFAGTDPAMWAAAAALAVAIVSLSPHKGAASATAVAMVAAGVVAALIADPLVEVDVTLAEVGVLAVAAAAAVVVLPIGTVGSLTDRSARPMSPERIGAGWIAALVALAGVATFGRASEAGPIVAAMVAAVLYAARDRPSSRGEGPGSTGAGGP